MAQIVQGKLEAKGLHFAIVVSRFNNFIGDRLLSGALDALERHGARSEDITVVWVPGSFEVPLAAKKLALSTRFDAVLCVGALLRGGTPHFDHIAATVTKEIGALSVETGVPVIYGILTCDSMEQAIERAGLKSGNRGFEAAMAAIEMARVMKQL
jgi:6,7-dimethyl-8-ribityllumazine synthase